MEDAREHRLCGQSDEVGQPVPRVHASVDEWAIPGGSAQGRVGLHGPQRAGRQEPSVLVCPVDKPCHADALLEIANAADVCADVRLQDLGVSEWV